MEVGAKLQRHPRCRPLSASWAGRGLRLLLTLTLIAAAGCTRDFLNAPLRDHASNTELLTVPANAVPSDPDEPYIVMSLSGGGCGQRASLMQF
jgi:hypothetical protein